MPHPTRRPLGALALASALLSGCAALPAGAQPAPGGPCAYKEINADRWGKQDFRNPPEVRLTSENADTLHVRYTDPRTTALAGCALTLRTYDGQLVGPTYRVRPGQTMNLLLANQLPRESPDSIAAQLAQEASQAFIDTRPHSFNTTNLHTHGMHVSPVGNSDNVLLAIPPQTTLPYEIKVPPSHTRGTYWYHAHTHGSTAVQVGSGMAGALIVDDDPAAIPASLAAANAREKVFVIQTILYDTAGAITDITAFFPDNPQTDTMCMRGQTGCTWQNSKRATTVNGQIVPVIRMRPGEVQRWRLIDAAFREGLRLRLEGHTLYEIATDGIYTGRIDAWGPRQAVDLQPGYRSDVLVQASATPGRYRLVDDTTSAANSLRQVSEDLEVIAEVVVEGDPIAMSLPTEAEMARLNPFPGVELAKEADGDQVALFNIRGSPDANDPRAYFQINYAAFNPGRIRYLRLGATDQWTLQTVGNPHVFHIHVNPFQVERRGPDGRKQLVWKDSQFIRTGETITAWSRYTDYIGQYVIHCHILDHEDLGMMEIVEIVGEDGPLPAPTGHGAH
jgi:FtsP/CotA-like multicopper oxidase with cupredoxin domain